MNLDDVLAPKPLWGLLTPDQVDFFHDRWQRTPAARSTWRPTFVLDEWLEEYAFQCWRGGCPADKQDARTLLRRCVETEARKRGWKTRLRAQLFLHAVFRKGPVFDRGLPRSWDQLYVDMRADGWSHEQSVRKTVYE
jgi:hypothetical protein